MEQFHHPCTPDPCTPVTGVAPVLFSLQQTRSRIAVVANPGPMRLKKTERTE